MRRAALAVAIVAVAQAAGTASAPADVVLGSAVCSTPAGSSFSGCAGVSAYGDALVWSSFDPASGLYRLVAVRSSGGMPAALPAAGRPVPFGADLGPDGAGRPVAVYSRCAGEAGGPPKGCALYRSDLATGRETRVLAGVVAPAPLPASIWRSRIVYSGPRGADGLRHPTVCSLTGRPSCRALPAGPAGGRPRAQTTGPQRMDLRGRSVVFSWYSNPGRDALIRQTRIMLVPDVARTSRPAVQVARAGAGGAGNAAVFSPVLDSGAAYYARGGATCDYGSPPNTFGRYDLRAHGARELPSPRIHGLARSGGTFVYEACPSFAGSAIPAATTIVRAESDPFAQAPLPLSVRACPARTAHGAGWLAPVTLSARSANPALAVGPAGEVAVAAGGFDGVRVRVRRAGQRAFGAPTLLHAVNAGSVQVAVDAAGRVIVAWQTNPPAQGQASLIQAAVSDARGRFGPSQTLRTIAGAEAMSGHALALAADGAGDAMLVWSLRTSIESAFRRAGGSFGAPAVVWSNAPGAFETSYGHALGMDDQGGVLLAWPVMGANVTTLDVSSAPAGAAFAPPVPLAVANLSLRAAAVAVAPDGSSVVAWIQREGRFLRAMVARRSAAGTFAPPAPVSAPQAPVTSVPPAAAAAGGRAIVAWAEQGQGGARVSVASDDATGAWHGQALTAFAGSVAAVYAAIDPHGDAAVAWDLRCGRRAGRRVIAATGRGGRALATPQVVSGPDAWIQMAGSSLLGIDRSGRVAVAWDGTGGRHIVTRLAETER